MAQTDGTAEKIPMRKFHTHHSSNIQLKVNQTSACKTEGSNGICFSESPIIPNKRVNVKIAEAFWTPDSDKLDMYVGLTCREPSQWTSMELERKFSEASLDRNVMWKVQDTYVKQGNVVFLQITEQGGCLYGINDTELGQLPQKVDFSQNMYLVVQFAGNTIRLAFTESIDKKKTDQNILEIKKLLMALAPGFEWKESTLEQLDEMIKYTAEKSQPKNIAKDHERLSEMVLASKHGNWKKCFDIVKEIPHMINGIPQERAWSALHQATFHDNVKAVQTFLEYKNCDPNIKAKQDRSRKGKPGFTPLDLALEHKKENVIPMLSNHESCDKEVPPSFMPASIGKQFIHNGFPYFVMAVAFLKNDIVHNLHIEEIHQFLDLTKKIYGLLTENLNYVKEATAETLYPFDGELRSDCKGCQNKEGFFSKLIWIYTTSYIYRQVNSALRRATLKLDPTGDDLLLCLYTLFLQSVLLHWDQLNKYKGLSYRAMILSDEEIALYSRGRKFFWMNFTSSLKVKSLAQEFVDNGYDGKDKKVIFTIDNNNVSEWSPRELKNHTINVSCLDDPSDFGVNELVHPAAALFVVKHVKRTIKYIEISIQLLKPMDI